MFTELASRNGSRDGKTSSENTRAADEETRGAGTETACNRGRDESQTRSTEVVIHVSRYIENYWSLLSSDFNY